MTGHSRNPEEHIPMSFLECIEQQDREAFRAEWLKLTVAKDEVTLEYVKFSYSSYLAGIMDMGSMIH